MLTGIRKQTNKLCEVPSTLQLAGQHEEDQLNSRARNKTGNVTAFSALFKEKNMGN
jgi:hypothetical protein